MYQPLRQLHEVDHHPHSQVYLYPVAEEGSLQWLALCVLNIETRHTLVQQQEEPCRTATNKQILSVEFKNITVKGRR